ncbi:MAG: hypothetical protein QXL17_02240 [Candidatus Thermoplasmatota archaeon]
MPTNIEVREALINCFVEAHKEFMKKGAEATGKPVSEEEIRKNTKILVKQAFNRVNADYDHPTKEDIMKVMGVLQEKAKAAGRDMSIIQKHARQMMELVNQL